VSKIVITIQDEENGRVRVDSKPHMQILAKIARGGDLTAAEGYALGALAKIIKDSRDNLRAEMADKESRGLLTPRLVQ